MFAFLQTIKDRRKDTFVFNETRSSLAPRKLYVGDSSYHSVRELAYALSLPECRNIALTGVFGSGKSSVINTYLATKNAPKQVLRISLSNLIENNVSANEESYYTFDKDERNGETVVKLENLKLSQTVYENEIEYKIFQQMIHKADYRKTVQSCHRRINALGTRKVIWLSLNVILFLLCFIILFEPKICHIQSFQDLYSDVFGAKITTVNAIADMFSAIIMMVQLFCIIRIVLPQLYSFRIKSFKAKDCEVNFEDKEPLFSKWLDDILYFLKSGEYALVIFEDLDRISHPQELFLKLREINILLNESEYFIKHNRIIRFVYAIKDDVFQNEVRTKFFDYIIPIVPIIDYFNSGEYMIEHCKGIFTEINDSDLKQLGLYVTRMRDLLNIINEYQLYKKTIVSSSMSQKKLLAMMIYKNLYPSDYSYLHDKKGCLCAIFNNKQLFYKELTTTLEENRDKTQEEIKTVLDSLIGMRKVVLDVLKNNYSITRLIIGGKSYSLDEVSKSKTLFESLQHNRIEQCVVEDEDRVRNVPYIQKFCDIIEDVDSDSTFWEQKGDYELQLDKFEMKLKEYDRQIGIIRNYSLCQMMRKIGDGNTTISMVQDICNKANNHPTDEKELIAIVETIHSMVRNGYITEDYSSYISYTYHGSFSEEEFNYLQSVIQGIHVDYNYPLKHISSFISSISSDNYSDRSILNFDFANFIFSNNDMDVQCGLFIQTARKYFDFIISYDTYQGRKNKFFSMLFNGWSGCVNEIMSCNDMDVQGKMLSIYLRESPQSEMLSNAEIDFLDNKYEFIVQIITDLNWDRLKEFIRHFNLRFQNLVIPNENSQSRLYDFVINHSHFAITFENLLLIYGERYKSESLSCILSGTDTLREYLLNNIQLLYSQLSSSSKQENEQALVFTIKSEELSNEQVSAILSGQKSKISSLNVVPENRYALVLKGDFVNPSWDNVRQFFTISDNLSIIAPFIDNHSEELAKKKLTDGDEQLQVLLMGDNDTLSIDSYKRLVESCVFAFEPEEVENLSEERLEILLDHDLLEYSKSYNNLFSKYSSRLLAKYIIKYFDKMETDKGEIAFENSNSLGIYILSSDMAVDKKAIFLKNYACLIEIDGQREELYNFACMICEFYHQHDCSDADYNLIIKSLKLFTGEDAWFTKIELINKIHRSTAFNKDRTVNMVNTLGYPYTQLNDYSSVTYLDNNPQNNELVDYLRDHIDYICNKIDKGGQIKITYHHNPK